MNQPSENPQDNLAPAFDFDQFLQNQAQELALRREEIELKREQAHHNLEYANKALEAQLEDRARDRGFAHKVQRDAKIFVGLMV
ncbi:MAG: hypothetical protein AB7P14_13255 [Blastocatellales bacterium]